MNKNLLGKHVITHDGHEGIIIKQYKPTGVNQESIRIQQVDGQTWYCPVDDIKCEVSGRMKVKIMSAFNSEDLEDEITEFSINNDIIDIKYSMSDYVLNEISGKNHYTKYSVLVVYKRKEE